MFTSSRNCESGSAVQLLATGSGEGADTATPPAHSASSVTALRSQRRPPDISGGSPLGPARLAQDRLGLGEEVAAVVKGLDILDGDLAGSGVLVCVVEGEG